MYSLIVCSQKNQQLHQIVISYDVSFLVKYLLVMQGIESNPGPPYSVIKSVQGDFNQADAKFGASAGTQCAINSLVAICFPLFLKKV